MRSIRTAAAHIVPLLVFAGPATSACGGRSGLSWTSTQEDGGSQASIGNPGTVAGNGGHGLGSGAIDVSGGASVGFCFKGTDRGGEAVFDASGYTGLSLWLSGTTIGTRGPSGSPSPNTIHVRITEAAPDSSGWGPSPGASFGGYCPTYGDADAPWIRCVLPFESLQREGVQSEEAPIVTDGLSPRALLTVTLNFPAFSDRPFHRGARRRRSHSHAPRILGALFAGVPDEAGGLMAMAGEEFRVRHSLCCGRRGCRRRVLPPSFRLLGRRVYLGLVVIVASVFAQLATSLPRAATDTGVPRRTLRRWALDGRKNSRRCHCGRSFGRVSPLRLRTRPTIRSRW